MGMLHDLVLNGIDCLLVMDDMGFGYPIWYWKCRLTKRKSTMILPPPPLPFRHSGISPFGIPGLPGLPGLPVPALGGMGIAPFGLPWNPAIGPPANIFIG